MSEWTSIYIRDAISDKGTIPSGVRTASHSPDIIPYGTTPMADPNTKLVDTWDQDIGKDVVAEEGNYLYVRGKNLSPDTLTGEFSLYYANAGTILQPDTWTQIGAYDGSETVQVQPTTQNSIALPEQSFFWNNVTPPPTNSHYCLIATYKNSELPNPVPTQVFTSIADYVKWVTDSPNVAWRNIYVAQTSVDSHTENTWISNPDTKERDYMFTATCNDIPVGTVVTMSCDTQKVHIYTKATADSTSLSLTSEKTLPQSWTGAPLMVTAEAPQGKNLDGATIMIRQYLLDGPDTEERIAHLMLPVPDYIKQARPVETREIPAARAGEFTVYFSGGDKDFAVPVR
jgi:hypothetical protein